MPDPTIQPYIQSLLDALGPRDPLAVLAATPEALRQAIAGVGPAALDRPEAPGKWSLRQVVQHFADSELVGGFRFRMILTHDRPPIPAYDQDLWINRLHRHDTDLDVTLAEFTTLRRANHRLLSHATPAERARVGVHSERGDESLDYLIRIYAGHDLVHLRQIARVRKAGG